MTVKKAFHAMKKLLNNQNLWKTKICINEISITPIMMYGAGVMIMTKKESLQVAGRRILKALEITKRIENKWNYESRQESGGNAIINRIKQQRVTWLGHISRAGDE